MTRAVPSNLIKAPLFFHMLESEAALINYLTYKIKHILAQAIEEKGVASLVLPGGETPRALYRALNQVDIPWLKVHVFLSDERWISVENEDSNAYWIRKLLLQNRAANAHFFSFKTNDASPHEALTNLNEMMQHHTQPFDCVVLGMGLDGHVASLFPPSVTDCQAENKFDIQDEKGDFLDIVEAYSPVLPIHRVSLTLSRLKRSQHLAVLMKGREKWDNLQGRLRDPLDENHSAHSAHSAIEALIKQYNPLHFYWAP